METSIIIGDVHLSINKKNEPSRGKVIGFVIAIILGLGSLAAAGVGLGGYLQAGLLSNLGRVNSMIMMTAGAGGILFLIIGIVGSIKSRQIGSHQTRSHPQNDHDENIEDIHSMHPEETTSMIQKNTDAILNVETHGGLIYGADAWKIWGVEVLDLVPQVPDIRWDEKDPYFKQAFRNNYVLLYIPQSIWFKNERQNLNLRTLQTICSRFDNFRDSLIKKFGNEIAPGWILISKTVIPESRSKGYRTQKELVELNSDSVFHLPRALEATALNLMVDAVTQQRLYGDNPETYTRCVEMMNDTSPAIVGGFGSDGLDVCFYDTDINGPSYGVGVVLRDFDSHYWSGES